MVKDQSDNTLQRSRHPPTGLVVISITINLIAGQFYITFQNITLHILLDLEILFLGMFPTGVTVLGLPIVGQ